MRIHLRAQIGILLFGLGVSNIGDFIYLVALNIFVLMKTHSPVVVAGIWVIPKISALLVGPWAGSISDRLSLRKQLIVLEFTRAILVGVLPFVSSIKLLFVVLFLLGICSTFFGNTFLPYQTHLIPKESRKQVNSIASLLRSGAVVIGPAISGFLLAHSQTSFAILLNASSFLVSAITMCLLPEFPVEKTAVGRPNTWSLVRSDWKDVIQILRRNKLFTTLFCFNACSILFAITADSQEVVFAQEALHLGTLGFGMMVTAAGVGFIAGAFLLSVGGKYIPSKWLIGIGFPLFAIGYFIYANSYSFWWAVTGLIILGIFNSSVNVGFTTFTQYALPVNFMGRVNNILGLPQQVLQIVFMLSGGFLVHTIGIRALMISMTIALCVIAFGVAIVVFSSKHQREFLELEYSHSQ